MKNPHTLFVAAGLAAGCSSAAGEGPLVINEVASHNLTTLQDASGAYPDWIELHNRGGSAARLAGRWISDDATDPLGYRFPDDAPEVGRGEYLVVFADEDTEQGPLHLSFALDSGGGEDVVLFGPVEDDMPVLDEVLALPALDADQSFARTADGWITTAEPTPGEPNE
jgi:Lamin Tail Domain